jgi:hypothetical protein
VADVFDLRAAVWVVAVLSAASGLVVARRMTSPVVRVSTIPRRPAARVSGRS